MDATLVDLPQELMKDALFHLEEARRYEGDTDPFPLWREVRSAVLFSVTAIEAFMNKAAAGYVRSPITSDQVILDYLQEKQRFVQDGQIKTKDKFVPLGTKISEWTRIITGMSFDKSDSVWQTFLEVKAFRDALVHYRSESSVIYNDGNVAMAKKAVANAKSIMLRYYQCSGKPAPPWLNNIEV